MIVTQHFIFFKAFHITAVTLAINNPIGKGWFTKDTTMGMLKGQF